jgi:hypothetical protein
MLLNSYYILYFVTCSSKASDKENLFTNHDDNKANDDGKERVYESHEINVYRKILIV